MARPTATPPPPPAAAPPAGAGHDDLSDILDQLHEEMELGEHSGAIAPGTATTLPTDVTRPTVAAAVVIEPEGGLDFQPSFASFGARLLGLMVDVIVLALLCSPGMWLMAAGPVAVGVVLVFAGFCLATLLYARGVANTGQSFGNRLTRTHVVDARNGRMIPLGDAAARYAVRMLISSILLIGFLVAVGNSQRRAFHDNVAGTVVVRPKRERWSIDDEVSP